MSTCSVTDIEGLQRLERDHWNYWIDDLINVEVITQHSMAETARLVVLAHICSWWQNSGLAQF